MKIDRMQKFGALLTVALFILGSSVQAENWVRYDAQPGSKLKIDGTSTIHDWTVEGSIIGGFMEVNSAFEQDAKTIKVNPRVQASVPVRTIKSGKSRMDQVMHGAMKMKEHPNVEYKLLELTPKDGSQYVAKGELTVAGVAKTFEMPVTIERMADKRLKVTGTTPLKMTDFGINPPAPQIALGLIKTGDDVTVSFEWVIAQRAQSAQVQ
jgi:polyisoprenoid-binding protein YceI